MNQQQTAKEINIIINDTIIDLNEISALSFIHPDKDNDNGPKIIFFLKKGGNIELNIKTEEEFNNIKQNIKRIKSPFDVSSPMKSIPEDNYPAKKELLKD